MKRAVLPTPPADELLIVRDALVPKLSARSAGSQIGYKLGCTLDKSEAYLSLTENQGGGYFSREWVPLTRIISKLKNLDAGFPAISLKSAFVGKSVNNPSFLAAALVAEGVLSPQADKSFKLDVVCDPAEWRASLFTLSGAVEKLIPSEESNVSKDGISDTEASATALPAKKNNRGAKVKGLVQEGVNHEDHPQFD